MAAAHDGPNLGFFIWHSVARRVLHCCCLCAVQCWKFTYFTEAQGVIYVTPKITVT